MKIVVTGYRHFQGKKSFWDMMKWAIREHPDASWGVGDCPSGPDDWLMKTWQAGYISEPEVFWADWTAFGKAAGPIRNQQMIDVFAPDLVLAFLRPESKGARGCAKYAALKGIPVTARYW